MPLNSGTVLHKTDLGRQEVAVRSGSISAVQRRLLILVDGQRTVNALGAFVRVGELDDALAQLHARGLVAAEGEAVVLLPPAAEGFAASVPGELERPATSPRAYVDARQAASDFVRERLGSAGDPLCAAIERCGNPQDLRKVLRGIEVFVSQRLDQDTAQGFARHFGALLL